MSIEPAPIFEDPSEEIAALVQSLHATRQRLHQLTGGEVDGVLDAGGQTSLRPKTQEKLRRGELIERDFSHTLSAILNALPAHIALINEKGVILSVNEGWRIFARANALRSPFFCVGQNYLDICDETQGEEAAESRLMADGIRSVLSGAAREFSREYPCHSPTEKRWFRLMANPVASQGVRGAVIMHVNITKRKQAENALRESEASMSAAQHISHFGSWELDLSDSPHGLRWSDEMYRIAGYEPGAVAVTREFFFSIVPLEDRDLIRAAVEEAIRERHPYSIVHRLRRPDGEERVVAETGQVFYDETSGTPLKMIGTAQDITERRAAELALEKGERERRELSLQWDAERARLGATLDNLTDGFLTVDGAWRTTYVNAAAEQLIGHGRGELLGKVIWEQMPELQGPSFEQQCERAMSEKQAVHFEVADARQDRWLEVRAYPSAQDLALYLRDITERIRSQQRINEQAALIDEARDAIVVRDLDHCITFWSKGAERLFGWTAEEALGGTFADLVGVNPAKLAEAELITRERGAWNGELQKCVKGGAMLTLDSRWSLVRDSSGRARSIMTIDTDITARKEMELQFFRAQRLDSLGTLAGGIAHDLNNALSPMVLAIDLLKMQALDENGKALLAVLDSSAQRAADMVRQVLSFARGVEGRRARVDLHEIFRDIEKIVSETFLNQVRLRTSTSPELWQVLGDSTQLHQVLLNLCVNARDAMSDGGTLSLSAQNIELDAQSAAFNPEARPGPYVLLQVEDNGSGIPADVLDRIFDPFFTTKDVGKGTGLGLSSSLAIVKSHGGFFRVRSEPGNGTTFEIYLPAQSVIVAADDAAAAAGMASELPRGHGELVLVVDDEAFVRQITQQTLESLGYRTLLACDGADAVVLYATHGAEIAVVLTDMTMPVLGGPAMIHVLQKLNPAVRIIGTSGLAAKGHVANIPAKYFLSKPYTVEALQKALHEILQEGAGGTGTPPL